MRAARPPALINFTAVRLPGAGRASFVSLVLLASLLSFLSLSPFRLQATPSVEHTATLPFLRETLVFLALAGILIPLLQRLRINQVLGFLVAGIVLGPHAVGRLAADWPWLANVTFQDLEGVQSFAELGVVFLMFLIGLELSPQRLWSMRGRVFAGGALQVLLSACLIGGLAWAFGNAAEVAVILGLVLSLSSTAVVMQLLVERRAMASDAGQFMFAILMFQDLAVVPLLILMDMLARDGGASFAATFGVAAFKSVLAIGLIYLLGSRVLGPVFRFFADRRQPEVFVALTLLVALGIAGITAAAGLSLAAGALLAGILLAETEYRHEVEVTIEPFKGLLMGLFFLAVGMSIDVGEVARHPVLLVLSVVGLFAIKAVVVAGIFRGAGLSWGAALESGLLLGQGGEFAFVVVGYAVSIGLLDDPVGQFMLLVVSISMVLTTPVARLGGWLGNRLRQAEPEHGPVPQEHDASGHMVIAGYGRVGQLMGELLGRQGIRYVAIEHNASVAAAQRRAGKPVVYGNAARLELLGKLNLGSALALFVTMDQPAEAMHAVRGARRAFPDLPIYARSRDEHHARELRAAGATAVIPETLEASLQLSAFALSLAGLSEGEVDAALHIERSGRV